MVSLTQFDRNMQRRAKALPTNLTRIKRSVASHVVRNVMTTTPFKTGRARASWNVSFNAPDYSYDFDSFTDGSRGGDWVAKMATSRAAVSRALDTDTIYISSGLPYIGDLNRGSSNQTPAGYVERVAVAGAQVARRIRVLR